MSERAPVIRRAKETDACGMIEAQHAAIRQKAGEHYHQDIIDLWAPRDITAERINQVEEQIKGTEWFTLVAEAAGIIIGYGQVSLRRHKLGAVYVQQNSSGPVGKMILEQLIEHAKEHKAGFLEMESSVNAREFYESAGFKVLEHRNRPIGQSGKKMASVKMRIDL